VVGRLDTNTTTSTHKRTILQFLSSQLSPRYPIIQPQPWSRRSTSPTTRYCNPPRFAKRDPCPPPARPPATQPARSGDDQGRRRSRARRAPEGTLLTTPVLAPRQVHKLCQAAAPQILDTLRPHLIIAIGGGGYIPARILRCVSCSCVSTFLGTPRADRQR
jgi:hypothetical protein